MKKIMIVEDEEEIYTMYKLKFEKNGHQVNIAKNGFEAGINLNSFSPDIILLDIMMPDIDGIETLKILRDNTSFSTKIFIFSNLSSEEYIEKTKKLGADDYFVKAETSPSEILQIIEKIE